MVLTLDEMSIIILVDTTSKELMKVRYQLKKLRVEKGLTVEHIAAITGISASHYYKIEQGSRNPAMTVARRIADALNSTVDALFFASELDDSSKEGSIDV